jgi:hypothetical protein
MSYIVLLQSTQVMHSAYESIAHPNELFTTANDGACSFVAAAVLLLLCAHVLQTILPLETVQMAFRPHVTAEFFLHPFALLFAASCQECQRVRCISLQLIACN